MSSNLGDLLSALKQLEPTVNTGWRKLLGPDLMQSILTEISRTILPRSLVFRDHDKRTLTRAVASGRIKHLGENKVVGPEERKREFLNFVEAAKTIEVRVMSIDQLDMGRATEAKVNSEKYEVAGFCELIKRKAKAALIRVGGENPVSFGSAGHLQLLSAVMRREAEIPNTRFAALCPPDFESLSLIVAISNAHSVVALTPAVDTTEIAENWVQFSNNSARGIRP